MDTGTPTEIPPEGELLLCFARLTLGAAERARSRHLIAAGPNWKVLLELASTHGLGPLLYRHLEAMGHEGVPDDVFARSWCSYEMASRRNLIMAAELSRITILFESSGIPAIPYKGPSLATAVYGDVALRQFGDLDILLRPQDITAAMRLLLACGYSAEYDLRPDAQTALLRSSAHYHLALIHDQSGIMVELHWKSDPDYPVETLCANRLWGPLPANGGGRDLPTAELLLILCLHGSKHRWTRLGWLVDIAELIRQHPELDWARVLGMAKSLAAERRLTLGLHLAHRLLGVQTPAQLTASRDAASMEKLAPQIIEAMFAGEPSEGTVAGTLSFNLALYDRPTQRLRHLLNVVFEPSLLELSRWPLPLWLSFLYVPLRLCRLINKHARQLLTHPQ